MGVLMGRCVCLIWLPHRARAFQQMWGGRFRLMASGFRGKFMPFSAARSYAAPRAGLSGVVRDRRPFLRQIFLSLLQAHSVEMTSVKRERTVKSVQSTAVSATSRASSSDQPGQLRQPGFLFTHPQRDFCIMRELRITPNKVPKDENAHEPNQDARHDRPTKRPARRQ